MNVVDLLKKAQYILRLNLDTALRKLNLTAPQFDVLAALNAQPGLSGAALARRCFVTPQAITGILRNLESAGLLIRSKDPEHGRIIQAHLTASGADAVRRAQAVASALEERMLGELDRAEREALVDLLAQCADALKNTPERDAHIV